MNIENALELMNSKAAEVGADQYDIIAGESQDSSVTVFRGKVKETEMSSSQGIGIRLFRDGRPGYSYTRSLTETAIKQCVIDAADLSQFSAPVDFTLPSQPEIEDIDSTSRINQSERISIIAIKVNTVYNPLYLNLYANRISFKVTVRISSQKCNRILREVIILNRNI